MRLAALVFTLGLAGVPRAGAEEVLVFVDGNRMTVTSWEVRGTVVVITTTDGKLRSFPASLVDVEASRGAAPAETASIEAIVPHDSEAKLRWALEHFGARSMLELFIQGIATRMAQGEPNMPSELVAEVARSLKEPFVPERFFDEVAREFERRARPESVAVWLAWLDTAPARRAIAQEVREDLPPPSAPPTRARAALVERLFEAQHPFGVWSEAFLLGLAEMGPGFRSEAGAEMSDLAENFDWTEAAPSLEAFDAELIAALYAAYDPLADAELDPYVRFWESPDGLEIGAALRASIAAAFERAGRAAGSGLARVYQTYFEISERSGDLPERAPAPAATTSDNGPETRSDHRSARFGYSMRLAGSGWSVWSNVEQSAPDADFGALRDTAAFIVVPVYLGELDPSIAALTAALLKRFDIDASTLHPSRVRDVSDAGRKGRAVEHSRNVEEVDYTYRFDAWKGDRIGYLVAAWSDSGDVAALQEALDRFEYDPRFAPPADLELSEREREWQGTILHDIGLDYFEDEQYGASSGFFRAAREMRPHDSDALLYLLSSLTHTSRFEEALDVWNEGGPAFADNLVVQSYRPFLLAKVGRRDEAVELYRGLFASGYQNDSDLYDYAELLVEMDHSADALAEVARYREERDSVLAARLHAMLHQRVEQHDRAIEILEAQLAIHPGDPEISTDLLDAYHDAGRHRESIELAASLAGRSGDRASLHFQAGRARLALGELAEAKAAFEAALDLDPSDAASRDYLDYVSGLLGEGDHELARRPIEAVPLPDAVSDPPRLADDLLEASRDYGALYLDRSTAIAFRPGEDYRRTERYRIRISDTKAVSTFSTFKFEVDPVSERLYVNELRVIDEKGRTVAEGDLSTYYLTDDGSDGMASSKKLLNVPVPGLAVGHTVALTVTIERRSPPRVMPFERHAFSAGYPVERVSLYVSGTVDELRFHGGLDVPDPRKTGEDGILWTLHRPPLYRTEGYAEWVESYLPFVWIGARGESWESIGRDYLSDIESRLVVDDEIRDLSRGLVEGLETSDARVEALADHVQQSLTYKALEFGRRAWMPSPAAQVVANRYGDCKDHAVLFYLLLRAAGEPAELVLVSTETEVRPEVPSMEQFDHMIVFAPSYRGGHFFDLTDKNHDVSSLPPLGLGGRSALLLSDEPELVTIPDYPSDSSRARAVRNLTVDGEDLVVSEVVTFQGYYGAWMRGGFKTGDAAARRERVLRYLDAPGRITVEELELENLSETKAALVLRLRYRLHGALHQADGKLIGRLPATWEKTLLEVPWQPERKTPFRVAYPLQLESEVRVEVPEGYVLASHPAPAETADSRFVDWRVSSELSERELVVRLESLRPRIRGTAEEYATLATTVSSLLDAVEPSLVLARE